MRRRAKVAIVVGCLALATALRLPADPPRSGAIVQRLSDTAATVLLHRTEPGTGVLVLSRAPEAATGSNSSKAPKESTEPSRRVVVDVPLRRLRFVCTELRPSTRYDFVIEVQSSPSDAEPSQHRGSFKTAPPPGTGSLRFAAFGDSGKVPWWSKYQDSLPVVPAEWIQPIVPGRGHQWEIAELVVENEVDLVLHLGDIVYPRGAREHYNEGFFDPFAKMLARIPMWPTIGNHDCLTEGAKPVLDYFDLPGRYYDFVHGPVHFFCLDTYSSELIEGSKQRAWLRDALAKSTAPWKVVFTHRPFLTVSRSKADSENRMLRDEIHPILAQHGVSLVFSGHDHNYQRFEPRGGVHYIVAGGGGKSLYDLGTAEDLVKSLRGYSFALVDVALEKLTVRGIDEDGEQFDRLEIPRR